MLKQSYRPDPRKIDLPGARNGGFGQLRFEYTLAVSSVKWLIVRFLGM
jgi:hypothetical protein